MKRWLGLGVFLALATCFSGRLGAGELENALRESQELFNMSAGQPLRQAGAFKADIPAVASPVMTIGGPVRHWVIGVQPVVRAHHYQNAKAFEDRMSQAIEEALKDPRIGQADQKLIVVPEYVATWLIAMDENASIYKKENKTQAIIKLMTSNAGFLFYLQAAAIRERHLNLVHPDFVLKNLVRYKAAKVWKTYHDAFSRIAKKNRVTLVAGSLIIPELSKLKDPSAPVYNTSAIFGPDGALLQVTRKVYPTESEKGFLTPGPLSETVPVDTPFGRVGNMICADGWYAPIYENLKDADFLVQPSLGSGGLEEFKLPWGGYSGMPTPPEVDRHDINRKDFTEYNAWRKYSLAGRIVNTRAMIGVNPFLSGRIWDIVSGGPGFGIDRRLPAGQQITEVPTDDTKDTFIVIDAGLRQPAAPSSGKVAGGLQAAPTAL